jgi:pimeloyl-ACP methyl ester carboxylesterase
MRTIALDLPGHGDSPWMEEAYTIDSLVDRVLGVVESLGEPVGLIGASLGGLISLLIAGERAADLCRALVLVDVAPRIEKDGRRRIIEFMLARPDGFASLDEAAAAVAAYNRERRRPPRPDGLRKNLRQAEDGRWRWHWDPKLLSDRMAVETGSEARFERAAIGVTAPTLLARGSLSDVLSSAGRRRFLELVPHAISTDVAAAGHMIAGDNNNSFSAVVAAFLADCDPSGPPSAGRG